MSKEEIIEIMSKPASADRLPKYRIIYQMVTGKPFKGCLCGNGFSTLYNVCKGYAERLKKE
jgi:hypothetical protein